MRRRRRTKLQTGKTWRWRSRKYFRKCAMKKREVSTSQARWNKIRGGREVLTGARRSCVRSAVSLLSRRAQNPTHVVGVTKFPELFKGLFYSNLHFSHELGARYLPAGHILGFTYNCDFDFTCLIHKIRKVRENFPGKPARKCILRLTIPPRCAAIITDIH